MKPSPEAIALDRLDRPPEVRAGDMYRCRCGVMLALGHKRHSRRRQDGHTYIWMYHFASRNGSLVATPKELRDHDNNALQLEKVLVDISARGERYVYVGNIFELLPLDSLGPRVSRDLL